MLSVSGTRCTGMLYMQVRGRRGSRRSGRTSAVRLSLVCIKGMYVLVCSAWLACGFGRSHVDTDVPNRKLPR